MGLDNYIQHDVFEAVLVDRDSAGAVVDVKVLGYTSETSFSHTTESEDLRAGIGNKFLPSTESDLVGTPKVLDQNNQPVNGEFTFSSNKIQLSDTQLVGQEVKVVYFIKKTELDGLAISAKTFPSAREIHLRSIVYDHDNNVVANVYYVVKRAIPNGNLDRSHAKGTNMTNQITFDCLEDSKGNYCYYFVERL